jgi:hypothetical protein
MIRRHPKFSNEYFEILVELIIVKLKGALSSKKARR